MLGTLRQRFPPTIRQLLASKHITPDGSRIEVNGWVKSVRKLRKVAFVMVSDGSSSRPLQATISSKLLPEGVRNGASVKLLGRLVESPGQGQDTEFHVDEAQVVGNCDPDVYPIQKQLLHNEYLRTQCHLRARVDKIATMLRVRDLLQRSIHSYFEREGFMYAHTPIITSNDCEGAGETFTVSNQIPQKHIRLPSSSPHGPKPEPYPTFFDKPAFLTVSSQLHLEVFAASHPRVFTLSPCFRAERSQTGRHLAEFWMLEAEWAFTNSLTNICDVVEDVVKESVRAASQAEDFDASSLNLDKPWPRMSYTDAIHILEQHHINANEEQKFQFLPSWGNALQSEHEKFLASFVGSPVFVTDYPTTLKPFYMRANDDGQTVACFDLLVPGIGEVAGGSLREERLELLDSALTKHHLDKEEYAWYRELRKYGGTPHGGFGLGFERLVSAVTGIDNVRECIGMPRWAGRMIL